MSRISSSALRNLAAGWSRGGPLLGGELSAMVAASAVEGQAQRVMTAATGGGKAFGGRRLLSSSSSFLNLFHPHQGHASGSCSRCGSTCRCASCCRCSSCHLSSSNAQRGMTTSATTSSSSTPSAPFSDPRRRCSPFSEDPHRRRSISSSAASSSPPVVDVTVASMGESITEGTVAAVLKSPGESVAADEVIAHIETDKVTIDVRAPFFGKVTSLEVKEGDSVVVGQVVCKVEEGAEGAVAAKPAAEAAEKQQRREPAAAAAAAAAPPPPPPLHPAPSPPPPPSPPRKKQSQRRKPSISFPARLTKAGVRISSLSAGDAKEARAAIRAAELDGPELAERLSRGRPAGSNATIPLYVGTERGTKLSASRVLSDREMEMIELGGAAP